MNKRSAGILMHISSLPSKYAIGDLGPAANEFADFLKRASQSIWQMLPLNPTSASQAYSPYSSTSSLAGNILFISPEILIKQKLITQNDLEEIEELLINENIIQMEEGKKRMLTKAYYNYRSHEDPLLKKQFQNFCNKENYWLHDFALYTVIKEKQNNQPWYQWNIQYKDHHDYALARFSNDHSDEIELVKFSQLLFNLQWTALKTYCSNLGIHLLGDLPIYVGHDSVDVWSNREIFSLDKNGAPIKTAGVPPDVFNSNGQLWGMPVFNWNVLKEKHYDWWVCRLKKNLEWFGEIRLDHFRAFSSYWEVDANETTAIKGKWKQGPGADFFQTIKKELNGLPFVAEDLGEIDDAVYELRDQFSLPGMNVLQFAFGEKMPQMVYIPHHQKSNSIVYTGTHDNNTTLGWYRSLKKWERKNLTLYTGTSVTKGNVVEILCRMAYGTVADRVILPMQDVLCLDEDARMNTPSGKKGNWTWKMSRSAITSDIEKQLEEWCYLYDRKNQIIPPKKIRDLST
ncbi:MAG: 4-alpha-glucanotransferase [Flavitalea sp.]